MVTQTCKLTTERAYRMLTVGQLGLHRAALSQKARKPDNGEKQNRQKEGKFEIQV